jgi:GxxExxY protein
VMYKDLVLDGQRLDLLVDPGVIVEIKAVEGLAPIHQAQLISYLKTTGMRLGLLINFNHRLLKNGIKRIIN